VTGEVQAFMTARVKTLHPGRRVATVELRSVGRGRSYAGAYVAPSEQLAPVADLRTRRQVGRVVKVDPTPGGGAELSLVVADDSAWNSLAAGSARVDVQVAFTDSIGGDPIGGRPLRVEIG
jgi:hypothetical protein